MTKLHAHFDGRVLIPDEPVNLPQGRTLEVEVREVASHGSARAILDAMKDLPTFPVKQGAGKIKFDDVRQAEDEL
jgi:hypothetical protein